MKPLYSFVAVASLLVGCAQDPATGIESPTLTQLPSVAGVEADLPGCDAPAARQALLGATTVAVARVQASDLVIASTDGQQLCVDTMLTLQTSHPKLFASLVSSNPMPGTDPAASNPMPGDDKGGSNPMPGTDPAGTGQASSGLMASVEKAGSNPMPGTGR